MGPPPLGLAPGDGGLTRGFENHLYRANTTLIFLASCLAFAEAALVAIARFTDVDPTLVAVFALTALGMVLASLVIMYWREPAFLTLSGEQAHDLRRLEILAQTLPDQTRSLFADDLASGVSSLTSNVRMGVESEAMPIESEETQRPEL